MRETGIRRAAVRFPLAGDPVMLADDRRLAAVSRPPARVRLTMKALLAMPPLFAVLGLLLVGCGGGAPPSGGVLAELQRVAPVAQGMPTLVFVYADG